MRYLIFGLAVIAFFGYLITPSYAGFNVNCYSGPLLIYSAIVDDVEYDGLTIITHTKGCKKDTFVMGACVITKT